MKDCPEFDDDTNESICPWCGGDLEVSEGEEWTSGHCIECDWSCCGMCQ